MIWVTLYLYALVQGVYTVNGWYKYCYTKRHYPTFFYNVFWAVVFAPAVTWLVITTVVEILLDWFKKE